MHNHQIKAARIPFPLCSTTGVLRRKLGSVTYSLFTDCFNLFPHLGAIHKVIADCFILFQSVKYPHGPPKRFGKKQNPTFEPSGPGRDPAKDKEWSSGLGMARDPSKLEERQEPERDLGGAPTRWTRNVL